MMSYDEIYTPLCELLVPYVSTDKNINKDSLLVDDLGLDSVQTMEMLMDLEDRLDASIPLNVLPEVHTVDDLVQALQQVI